MGVNPVPDNILSRRGGSRTARPPNPTVIPTHHSVVPAQIPTPKHGGGNLSPPPTYHAERSEAEPRNLASGHGPPPPPYLTSPHSYNCPSPRCPRADPDPETRGREPLPTSHISCRAQRSRAQESRIRARPPSSPLPDIPPFLQLPFPSLSPRRSRPPNTGAGNPPHYPHVIPSAVEESRSPSPRCPRVEILPP